MPYISHICIHSTGAYRRGERVPPISLSPSLSLSLSLSPLLFRNNAPLAQRISSLYRMERSSPHSQNAKETYIASQTAKETYLEPALVTTLPLLLFLLTPHPPPPPHHHPPPHLCPPPPPPPAVLELPNRCLCVRERERECVCVSESVSVCVC